MGKHYKIVNKKGKVLQDGFYYKIGCFIISGVYTGIKHVDFRITIRWGY